MILGLYNMILEYFNWKSTFKSLTQSKHNSLDSIHAFFLSNTFINNAGLKLAKNQANTKQHPEAELVLFDNYLHFSSTLSCKSNRTYSKK